MYSNICITVLYDISTCTMAYNFVSTDCIVGYYYCILLFKVFQY